MISQLSGTINMALTVKPDESNDMNIWYFSNEYYNIKI